jgi:hypothetical protein
VQRLCKYPILFQQLAKATPPSHPEAPQLAAALDQLGQVCQTVNEQAKAAENVKVLTALQAQVEGLQALNLVTASRSLVLDVLVKRVDKKKSGSEWRVLLLSDQILLCKVLTKHRLRLKTRFEYHMLRVIELFDNESKAYNPLIHH